MSGPCYYHPQSSAVAQCVQCGMPVCEECQDTVNDKAVCKKCVGAIRTRLEQEMSAAPAAAYAAAPAAQPGIWPPAPSAPTAYGTPVAATPTAPGIGRMIAGFALAAVLGIVGTALWIAITIATHLELALVAIGVGWLCGFGALKGVGQGGKAAAVIGAITALGATVIGAFLLGGGTPGIFEWFCVAVGTYEGYIVPTRAARQG